MAHTPSPDDGNGAAPAFPIEGDTTKATRMTESFSTMVSSPPEGMSPSDVLDQLADRLASRRGGGPGGGGRRPPSRLSDKLWGKAIYALGGAITLVFSWYMAVNQGLADRPTSEQMQEAVKVEVHEKIEVHEGKLDPHAGYTEEMRQTRKSIEKLNETLGSIKFTDDSRRRGR